MTETKTKIAYGEVVKPGAKLPNGAIVVACAEKSRTMTASPKEYVVLAMWLRGRNDCEYVTWATDESGEAYWGHYFDEDLREAVQDFFERCGE